MMKHTLGRRVVVAALLAFAGGLLLHTPHARAQGYIDTVLVANDAAYEPLIMVDPLLVNGWGIAIRPPGAGGHFWISNTGSGTTTTYVGDVRRPDGTFQPLFQDALTVVNIPVASAVGPTGAPVAPVAQPTGQVFNYSSTDFVVSGEGITGASKFLFVTGEGTISGWTEVRDANNVLQRQTQSVIMVDNSTFFDDERLLYTGCAVTDFVSNNRLFVTNWSYERVEVYDSQFQRVTLPPDRFTLPGPGEIWRPWNIQYLRTGPQGEGRLWVTFSRAEDPWEEYPDDGAVAEYDLEGNFIRRLRVATDIDPFANVELRAPWGLAIAPSNFGPFSGALLIANFGDGTIAGYDLATGHFIDFVRDNAGQPLIVDGIWGITFGNGVALGDSNALYYAAGPNGEADGTFGTIRYTPSVCPTIEQQPASVATCPSRAAVFTVVAPSPVRCDVQWQVQDEQGDWTNVQDGVVQGLGTLRGADSLTLTIEPQPGIKGALRCVISNPCGSTTSSVVSLSASQCDCIDFNGDALSPDSADIDDFLAVLAGASCSTGQCGDIDFNNDGLSPDSADLDSLLSLFAGGPCL